MLSPSEALYGFAGWLTSRDEAVTMGSTHECAIVADLVDAYCKANNLPPPGPDYPKNLVHPAA